VHLLEVKESPAISAPGGGVRRRLLSWTKGDPGLIGPNGAGKTTLST